MSSRQAMDILILSSIDGPTGSGNVFVDMHSIAAISPRFRQVQGTGEFAGQEKMQQLKGCEIILKSSQIMLVVHEPAPEVVAKMMAIAMGRSPDEYVAELKQKAGL